MASAPPPRLPVPMPSPAQRRDIVLADGSPAQQLLSRDGRYGFQFVRTLQEALMGKVKSAVVCAPAAGGAFAPPPAGAPFTLVAVKQLIKACVRERRTRLGKAVQEDPLNEVAVMALLREPGHANVMRLLHFFEDEKYLYIVYEYLNAGELFEQVSAHGKVDEDTARRYFFDTLQGTRYIHAHLISHRDLSLENVMLHQTGATQTAKLIDFGLAVVMPSPADVLLMWDGKIGKERYMAPETYAGQAYDGRKIDVWCMGMMLFVLLFGIYPYKVPSAAVCPYFQQIAEGNLLPMLGGWGFDRLASPEALHLIDRMLTVDPRRRATTDEVLAHPWLKAELEAALAAAAAEMAAVAAAEAAAAAAAQPGSAAARAVVDDVGGAAARAAAMSIDDGTFRE